MYGYMSSLPPYVFKARCLIRREENFDFILLLNQDQAITPPEEASSRPVHREFFKIYETTIFLLPPLRAVIQTNNQVKYIHVVIFYFASYYFAHFTTSVPLATEQLMVA
jgi:hypothetical protein